MQEFPQTQEPSAADATDAICEKEENSDLIPFNHNN